MRNAGLDEAQAGIKIARRNINNLRYADDTTLMVEKWRGTKELLDERERGEWKSWLKTQYSKNKDHGIRSHHFMANTWEKMGTVTDFIFLGSKITADGDCSHEIKRYLLLGRKARVHRVAKCWTWLSNWTTTTKKGEKRSQFLSSLILAVARASKQEGILTYLSLIEGWFVCLFELTWIAKEDPELSLGMVDWFQDSCGWQKPKMLVPYIK